MYHIFAQFAGDILHAQFTALLSITYTASILILTTKETSKAADRLSACPIQRRHKFLTFCEN